VKISPTARRTATIAQTAQAGMSREDYACKGLRSILIAS
jgi:hypothetical protein